MEQGISSTTYAPLKPPYQIIKYNQDVAIQIGTLIVTFLKSTEDYQIETHSYPVVAYEDKKDEKLFNEQLTGHQFLEGAVWNNVEVRDVTTVCLSGATLTWQQFLKVLESETFSHTYRVVPDAGLFWQLKKCGIKVLPPEERECTIYLKVMPQPKKAGLSLQSDPSSQLFLNVSIAEDEQDKVHVEYNESTGEWDCDVWKENMDIVNELSTQLHAYQLVLRSLLSNERNKHFNVTYKIDDERFQSVVEMLNESFADMLYSR